MGRKRNNPVLTVKTDAIKRKQREMRACQIRTRYERVAAYGREFNMPSKTRSEFRDDVNVNVIVEQFARTKQMPHLNPQAGRFGDFTDAEDLQQSLDRVSEAFSEFALLPSEIRAYFNNNPVELVEFMADPANAAEGAEIGLYDPESVREYLTSHGGSPAHHEASDASSRDPLPHNQQSTDLRGESPARTEPKASAEERSDV